jgi:SAM-dependent methyltransferase
MRNCYLCGFGDLGRRNGQVRDNPSIGILECFNCGLVQLEGRDHITAEFYENSGMHGDTPKPILEWLKETDWDDQRRFDQLKSILPNKRILDFGSGAGGFLLKAKALAAEVIGVELENRVRNFWEGNLKILDSIEAAGSVGEGYDLITAFHVIEHLSDPRSVLTSLASLLKPNGRMVVEVPNASDALLTLYDCIAFQRFTYWSQHLYLFTANTLEQLIKRAGLTLISIQNYQRYSLSNHLYWLSRGSPGGHQKWSFLDSKELQTAYAQSLANVGKTDTLIAHLERADQ